MSQHGKDDFKVARLLETARDSGLVHIEIADPDMIDVDLSARLQDAYDLHHAVVVDTPDENPTTLRERAPGESTVYDVTDKKLQRELHQRGVCGEIAGVLIDADGHPAESDSTERMIGISAAQLRATPEVIGLAYSIARSPAVRAAVRGGFIKCLVTHPSLARALLAQPENKSLPDPPARKT